MNRTLALCQLLGWQGGTIHQVAKETGCSVDGLLYGIAEREGIPSDFTRGWFAARTCAPIRFRQLVMSKYRGNLDFWLGAAEGWIAKAEGR